MLGMANVNINNVLVTGCGGDIGQGIGKILMGTRYFESVVGCDLHDDHPGAHIFSSCELLPRAIDPDYFEYLRRLIRTHHIDMVIPTSEAEIEALHRHGCHESFEGIPLVVADRASIKVGLDKLLTNEFLTLHGLAAPWTRVVSQGPPLELPCIVKMRRGQGSKNFAIVRDQATVTHCRETRPDDIWQELLLPEDQEYTCGVFRARSGELRTLTLRRKLVGGLTGSGVVVDNPAITTYLERIAQGLSLRGSINVQLRLTSAGPIAFEINPRFSSTVVFRHLLGFQDLMWSIMDLMELPLEPYQNAAVGAKIYRGSHEYIVNAAP